jgi:two-component system, NtrC family, sensor kinase
MQLVVVYERLLVAAEAGPVSDALIAAVRAAEEVADLDYLRERVPGAFERATDGVQRVATIVRAMREFAHPPTTDKMPFDINQALRSTLVVASNEYKYIAEVQTEFGDLPPVMCDGGDINQVFLNLVVNAAHAIEDVTAEGERGTILLRTTAEDDHVRISVSDTGPGIPSAVAGRIYDPFFTTKDVGRGTGQGLAIARRIVVERHGGTLSFETEQGLGTTFHVRLPVGEQVNIPRETQVAA